MTESSTDGFQSADAAAQQQDPSDVDEVAAPCPLQQKTLIKVRVLDDQDIGVRRVAVVLRNGDDLELRGKTDSQGRYTFLGLEDEPHTLCLRELDKNAWEIHAEEPLEGARGVHRGQAEWEPSEDPEEEPASVHTVIQGDCIAKLGAEHGFFPDTIWEYGDNAELGDLRKTMYVLAPGDTVHIPAKEREFREVQARSEVTIRRKGLAETLKIRFLDREEKPKSGVPYLVGLKTSDDDVLADRQGETDDEGFLTETIPPLAIAAEVTLGQGPQREFYDFHLGHIDPLDNISGAQARLNNLGYACGPEDGVLASKTRFALEAFQTDNDLEPTGENDAETMALLEEAFLS